MAENRLSSISKADSDEKTGEFWDAHDLTEFDTDAPDTEFEVISVVPNERGDSSPHSGRLKIAQQFIAGYAMRN